MIEDKLKNSGAHEESLHEHEWIIYFKNGSTITNIPTNGKSVRGRGYFLAFDIDEAEDNEQKSQK